MPQKFNVVLISDCDVRDRFFIQELKRHYPDFEVFRLTYLGGKKKRKKILSFRSKLAGFLRRLRQRKLKWEVFGQKNLPPIKGLEERSGLDLNDSSGRSWLKSLEPDVLLTCRAPILEKETFMIPRLGTVNVHFGIAPDYRGNDTLFWPILKSDWEKIGVTLHEISKGIDTGEMLFRAHPKLESDDFEQSIEKKATELAAKETARWLNVVKEHDRVEGSKQRRKGKLYMTGHRTWRKDFELWWKRRVGRIQIPNQEEKVERFYY